LKGCWTGAQIRVIVIVTSSPPTMGVSPGRDAQTCFFKPLYA